MFFKTNIIKPLSVYIGLATILQLSVCGYTAATQDDNALTPYEIKQNLLQQKRETALNSAPKKPLQVMLSSGYMDISSADSYDTYYVTVTNSQGFSRKIETNGGVSIYELDLPYDGVYAYEVLAVKHTNETVADVINNGRGENSLRSMTLSQKASGQFSVSNDEFVISQTKAEPPAANALPNKPIQPTKRLSFWGDQQ